MTGGGVMPDKESIRRWWAENPMTYGEDHGTTEYVADDGGRKTVDLGSREFFELADETFYNWNTPLHGPGGPFTNLFPFERHRGKRVLEIGCGMGCMAMHWARNGAAITAVDLNPVAVEQTRRRFAVFGLEGDIGEADGERLPFADNSFDYVYSWGVLHHSPHTDRSIAEILRVLKPGAEMGVMLYHRQSLLYHYLVRWVEGFVNMESAFLDEHTLSSRYSDGGRAEGNPHTWPVTRAEVLANLTRGFADVRIRTLGTDVSAVLDHWLPGLGSRILPKSWIKALARRWGWSLWISAAKPTGT